MLCIATSQHSSIHQETCCFHAFARNILPAACPPRLVHNTRGSSVCFVLFSFVNIVRLSSHVALHVYVYSCSVSSGDTSLSTNRVHLVLVSSGDSLCPLIEFTLCSVSSGDTSLSTNRVHLVLVSSGDSLCPLIEFTLCWSVQVIRLCPLIEFTLCWSVQVIVSVH